MKTIFLVDHFWLGHHEMYLKIYTKVLLNLGHQVVVLCQKPEEIKKWLIVRNVSINNLVLKNFDYVPSVDVDIPLLGSWIKTLDLWIQASRAINGLRQKPNLVFFLWLDSYIHMGIWGWMVDVLFPFKWTGLYLLPRHLRIRKNIAISNVFDPDVALRSKRVKVIAVLDEGVRYKLQSKVGKKVISFPDIADDSYSESFDKERLFNNRRPVIGLIGSLEKRKGVIGFLELASSELMSQYNFLLAGPITKHTFNDQELGYINSVILKRQKNLKVFDELIKDEAKFNSYIKKCDLLFLVYGNFPHSSNSLAKASYWRKPVLVERGYCMAERVAKYKIGKVVDRKDLTHQVKAIKHLLDNKPSKKCFDRYLRDHSESRLISQLSIMTGV